MFRLLGGFNHVMRLKSGGGFGILSSMSMGQDSSTKGILVLGVICFTWVGSSYVFDLQLEVRGGRKELPRGTIVIMIFSPFHLSPPGCFYFPSLPFYSLHHHLCFANTM